MDTTGMNYLINRYYDPTTDQFINVDPAVATANQPYAFVNDSPLNATDPLGLCSSLIGCLKGIGKTIVRATKSVVKAVVTVRKTIDNAVCGNPSGCNGTPSFAGGLAPGSSSSEAISALSKIGLKVPSDYIATPANSGNGWVFRPPGSNNLDNAYRAMDGSQNLNYSNGYRVKYSSNGNPLNSDGLARSSRGEWHQPFGSDETPPGGFDFVVE